MTDRLLGFTVVLNDVIRDDDAEAIRQALLMVKGVADVAPLVADSDTYFAVTKAKCELIDILYSTLKDYGK